MWYAERESSDVDFTNPKNGKTSEDKGVFWEENNKEGNGERGKLLFLSLIFDSY